MIDDWAYLRGFACPLLLLVNAPPTSPLSS